MSYLSDKFNIPSETVKNMMDKGVIGCYWAGWETVHKLHSEGKSIDDIIHETKYSRRMVFKIIKECKK